MSELQPSNTDTILGGQNPPPVNAVVLGGVTGEKWKLAHELGLCDELAAKLSQTHDIFSFETVTVNEYGEIITRTNKQAFYYTENLDNGVSLDMVYIPAGSFMMGSNFPSEKPIHKVTLKSFYLAKYLITQAQYMAVMRKNRAYFNYFKGHEHYPVECVSRKKAMEFCLRLSGSTARKYTLPSESQWEYSCRAGTNTSFYCGDTITMELANYDGRKYKYDNPKDKYKSRTTPVGKYLPNPWGLYDMHGNVYEWCLDNRSTDYTTAPVDGSAWRDNNINNIYDKRIILRGGCFFDSDYCCRSSYRYNEVIADFYNWNIGFRVVCL
jgi:formylglycine-generating enzyme required for sulfatase activity